MGNTLHVIKEWIKYTGHKDLDGDQENNWGNEYEINEIPYRVRILFSTLPLTALLVFSQIRLYGRRAQISTSNSWIRTILASNAGTLMELGILPILTTKLLIRLLLVTQIITTGGGSGSEEWETFQWTTKLLGIVVPLVYAICYSLKESDTVVTVRSRLAIIIQLWIASVIISYLNEIHRKFGLANTLNSERSSSIFIAMNFYELIARRGFSGSIVNTGRGSEFVGAVPTLLHVLTTRPDKIRGLREALYRQNLPNLYAFWGNCFLCAVVFCFKGFKTRLPVRYTIGFALLTVNLIQIWPPAYPLLASYLEPCLTTLVTLTIRLHLVWPYPFEFLGSIIKYGLEILVYSDSFIGIFE